MKGYWKIKECLIHVSQDEIEGADLEDNLISQMNFKIVNAIMDCAQTTNCKEYCVVIYKMVN